MTMNKNILWAVCGAMLLAGCGDKVMRQRRFVPADDPGTGGKSTVTEVQPVPAGGSQVTVEERIAEDSVKPQATAPESKQPRTAEFQPMTAKFDDSGISSDAPEVAAGSGEYIVRPGDTLGRIALRHHVRLTALMKANKLTDKDAKRLRIGQKLTIPGGKTAGNAPAGNAKAAKGGARKSGGASIHSGEYIVKAGDTPERIARRAKIRLADLMAANQMTPESAKRLRVGQKLVIPNGGGKGAAPAAQKPAKADKRNGKSTTAVGDAPAKSAVTPNATPAEAKKNDADAAILNQMQNQQTEKPVAAADIPGETPLVEVTEDISLKDFARKYNTTPEALRAANPDGIGDIIKKDQLILIPR